MAMKNWNHIERYVMKLQQRIYHAESQKNHRKVISLQRLLLRSRAALLLSIRRVTQLNKGKRTAGVDGITILSAKERVWIFNLMRNRSLYLHKPKPAHRIYIKKKNGKLRPLGIPTVIDRVYQCLTKLALEPQWENNFESSSYGFRPKRSVHDAIQNLFLKLNSRSKKLWVFEGDFKG
jgi:RNA-directed DNA polymerase